MIPFYSICQNISNNNSKKGILYGDTLKLHPGDKIFVEVSKNSGKIKLIKIVDSIKDPSLTIQVSFKYEKVLW